MSHFITLTEGVNMTTAYRGNSENILDSNYRNQQILPQCETFDRADLDDVLAQTDCKAIRIYYSMDRYYKLHAIVVGVDSNDEDILISGDEKIMEKSRRCPSTCPPPSALNS